MEAQDQRIQDILSKFHSVYRNVLADETEKAEHELASLEYNVAGLNEEWKNNFKILAHQFEDYFAHEAAVDKDDLLNMLSRVSSLHKKSPGPTL